MNTRFAREHVVSVRCTATKWHCFWTCDWQFLSLRARTSHPSYLSPHLSPRPKFGFIRPPESPLHAVLPPLLTVSLSLSSLARLFGTPRFSSPIFYRSPFYPCFSRPRMLKAKYYYLTVIYIFLLFNIFQSVLIINEKLSKNEMRIFLSSLYKRYTYPSIIAQFLLYIFPLLTTISHRFSILLSPVVSWLLRSSPPLCTTLSRPVT